MRILNACTAASFLFTTATAAAAQTCTKPFEQTAVEVVQLKSALMVGALSCGASSRYDAFMTKFQPYILQEQQVMDRFFHRTGGVQGQAAEDQYVTLLANTQSQASIADGRAYCGSIGGLFTQVAAVQQDADLDGLADAQAATATGLPSPCGGTPAAPVLAANAAAAASAVAGTKPQMAAAKEATATASVQNLAAEGPAQAPANAASLAALSRQIQALQAQLATLQSNAQLPVQAADRTASAAVTRPNTAS